MQVFFKFEIYDSNVYILGSNDYFSFPVVVRKAWIQNTPDKNTCFWTCLIGTIIVQTLLLAIVELARFKAVPPTEKVKITINSNIPRDSIELIINSNYEAHSTDLP